MALPENPLWRDASLATDVAGFLARAGAGILADLDARALLVRVIAGDQLDTIAMVRRGVVGVTHPNQPRSPLPGAAMARLTSWIEAGRAEHAGPARGPRGDRGPSAIARDVLRGVDAGDAEWWLVPLVASSEPLGVLLVAAAASDERAGSSRARASDERSGPGKPRAGNERSAPGRARDIDERGHLDLGRLAAVSEPIAAVLAAERARRQLSQLRDAAEADKAAALARLHLRDLGEAIVGADAGLRGVMKQVEQVAATGAPVLILGETGSGKEVVARAIHERSGRGNGPILRVNCGAIPPELVDSELFGHERGSFTGAQQQRSGWFERADGGTLFLDEIGELPLAAQVRLLRVVQDGVFERVGGTRSLEVDVRLVAATHRDLGAMVRAGQFREDLWYRINVFVIRLPPLRERLDDIAPLAEHFAERAALRFGSSSLPVTPGDLALLRAYAWPGNVRELSAVIERAAILGEGRRLDVERSLGVRIEAPVPVASGSDFPTLDEAMKAHIERALVRCQGRIEGATGAAQLLGLHPNTLRSRMTKLGVAWSQFRGQA